MVAPTPVSALLHAVAVVKVGVFTIMKIAIYIFGIHLLAEQGLSTWLMFVACDHDLVCISCCIDPRQYKRASRLLHD